MLALVWLIAASDPLAQAPRRVKEVRQPYHTGDPIPDGAHLVEKPRLGLWVSGTVILALSWATTGLVTTGLCAAGCPSWSTAASWVPVFGPIANAFVSTPLVLSFMVTMAILQAAGAGLVLGGALSTSKYLVYDAVATQPAVRPTAFGAVF